MNRAEGIRRLRAEPFDVLVVGGGITGAAAARDAASRGLRTAIVEARDFGEGTSSRSSRLIHGGLRYLEQFEFDLVFEASRERRTLLRIAPHMVKPLEFLFPLYRQGRVGRLAMTAGMWLYDALSLFRNIERHQMLSERDVLWREPTLSPEGLLGGARYFDAQVDDARLVLATVRSAVEWGAAAANRVAAEALLVEGDRLRGVRVRDTAPRPRPADPAAEAGPEWEIRAEVVVNATGPWTDETVRRSGIVREPLLRPTRGTHIHVRRDRIGHQRALIFESSLDGRIMFVLPWDDLTLIGTTDRDYAGPPEDVRPTGDDVRYLLDSTNRLFPDARLGAEDVISAWAGLRPLVASPETEEEGEVSREHVIQEELPGLITIAGGKLTSHRAMAEEVIDRALESLDADRAAENAASRTGDHPLPGGDFDRFEDLLESLEDKAAAIGLDPPGLLRLAEAHGTRAAEVLELAAGKSELCERVVADRPYVAAEIVYSVREEMPVHVEDVVFRRTHLALETEDFAGGVARVAEIMREELAWDTVRERAEVERAAAIREKDELFRAELQGEDE